MSSKGMGACYVSCSDQRLLRILPEDHKEEILRKYYDTYHRVLELAVEERLGQYGSCLIIDYAHVCITNSASVYKVDPNTLPRDELMQEIWLKVAEVIGKKFTIR